MQAISSWKQILVLTMILSGSWIVLSDIFTALSVCLFILFSHFHFDFPSRKVINKARKKNPILKDCGLSGEQWLIWRQPGDEEVDLYYPVFMTVRWYYDNYEMTFDKDAHQSEELLLDFVQQFLNSSYKRILMNRKVSLSGVCLRLRLKIVSIIPAPRVSQTTVR